MIQKEIIEAANNKSILEILEIEKILRESIRHWFSRYLTKFNDNNCKVHITIEDQTTIGLADCQKPILDCIYKYKDIIYFSIDNFQYELDEIELDTQIKVLKQFI